MLKQGIYKLPYENNTKYKIIEQPVNKVTIQQCIELGKQIEKERIEREKNDQLSAKKRAEKRKLSKEQQFLKLKKELGK